MTAITEILGGTEKRLAAVAARAARQVAITAQPALAGVAIDFDGPIAADIGRVSGTEVGAIFAQALVSMIGNSNAALNLLAGDFGALMTAARHTLQDLERTETVPVQLFGAEVVHEANEEIHVNGIPLPRPITFGMNVTLGVSPFQGVVQRGRLMAVGAGTLDVAVSFYVGAEVLAVVIDGKPQQKQDVAGQRRFDLASEIRLGEGIALVAGA
jgi:hypothetical protein